MGLWFRVYGSLGMQCDSRSKISQVIRGFMPGFKVFVNFRGIVRDPKRTTIGLLRGRGVHNIGYPYPPYPMSCSCAVLGP